MRRDRVQTAGGAVASALYGAAFAIQAASMRSAGNHVIQGFGAAITKAVQRRAWGLQPAGVHDWQIAIMQVHDELLVVHKPELSDQVRDTIKAGVESYRAKVPLIGMDWLQNAGSWADK
jgi:DNA polymerase I-like protein with 3'-5' exonuclease and polymerase domains